MHFTKDPELLNEIAATTSAGSGPKLFGVLLAAAWILAAALVTIGIAGLIPLAAPLNVLVFLLLTGAVLHVFATIRRPTPR